MERNIMQFIKTITTFIALVTISFFNIAYACDEHSKSSEDSVMIIRFNKPHIQYENSLKKLVDRALETKPDAKFTICAYMKVTGDDAEDKLYKASAIKNAQRIASSLQKMGINQHNIITNYTDNQAIGSNEIHISVE
jgi:hypothetical protein